MNNQPTLHLRVLAPTSIIFDGAVRSVSAVNHVGPFDILPGHTNFFTLISGGNVMADKDGDQVVFEVQKGILKVQEDSVTVYANVGTGR